MGSGGLQKKSSRVRYADRRDLDTRAANPPNFVPARVIFFVPYDTEENTRSRNHADERLIIVSAETIDPNCSLGNEPRRQRK